MGVIRDTCSFFRSIYEGSKDLKPAERLEIYETIFEYMFYDKEPESVKGTTRLAFISSKIAFDRAKERYDNLEKCGEYGKMGAQYGSLGGRPRNKKPPEEETETPKNPLGGYDETPKTPLEEEIEEEYKKEIYKEKKFTLPNSEEVQAYCDERKNGIVGEEFVDYYKSVGWLVGKAKTPMVDWKAAVRTWERKRKKSAEDKAAAKTVAVRERREL